MAALGALFQGRVSSTLAAKLGHGSPAIAKTLATSGVRTAVAENPHSVGLAAMARVSFVSGTRELLIIGSSLVMFGAIVGVSLVRGRDFYRADTTDVSTDPVIAG